MNNRKPPFDDVRIRQAFAMSVDRNEINNILYKGSRQIAYSQFATSSPWYAEDAGWLEYDQARRRKLVDEAKADGVDPTFTLTCVPTEESRQLLNLVKQQAAKVGLEADLEFVDQGAYVDKLLGADHNFVAGCSRNGENLTPDLYDGWHSNGSFNAEGYDNPEADADDGGDPGDRRPGGARRRWPTSSRSTWPTTCPPSRSSTTSTPTSPTRASAACPTRARRARARSPSPSLYRTG